MCAVDDGRGESVYFGGGFLMNSMPFSMLPLRPLMQASSSCCSLSVTPGRMLIAFSTPLGYQTMSAILWFQKSREEETYAQLHGGREELNAGRLGDLLTTGHAGEVDVRRLDDALLAAGGLDHGFGKSVHGQ